MTHYWIKSKSRVFPGIVLLSKLPAGIEAADGGQIISEEEATSLLDHGPYGDPQTMIFQDGQTGIVYSIG
jgi:hypothetical protein